jgi:hypothetical protein
MEEYKQCGLWSMVYLIMSFVLLVGGIIWLFIEKEIIITLIFGLCFFSLLSILFMNLAVLNKIESLLKSNKQGQIIKTVKTRKVVET